jgi:hypothetical protein
MNKGDEDIKRCCFIEAQEWDCLDEMKFEVFKDGKGEDLVDQSAPPQGGTLQNVLKRKVVRCILNQTITSTTNNKTPPITLVILSHLRNHGSQPPRHNKPARPGQSRAPTIHQKRDAKEYNPTKYVAPPIHPHISHQCVSY